MGGLFFFFFLAGGGGGGGGGKGYVAPPPNLLEGKLAYESGALPTALRGPAMRDLY